MTKGTTTSRTGEKQMDNLISCQFLDLGGCHLTTRNLPCVPRKGEEVSLEQGNYVVTGVEYWIRGEYSLVYLTLEEVKDVE